MTTFRRKFTRRNPTELFFELHTQTERDAIHEIEVSGDRCEIVNRSIGEAGAAQLLDALLMNCSRFARQGDGVVDQRAAARGKSCRRGILTQSQQERIVVRELAESLPVMLDSIVAVIGHRDRDGDHLPFRA